MTLLRIATWRAWTFFHRRPWRFTIGIGLLIVEIAMPRTLSFWVLLALTLTAAGKELTDILLEVFKELKEIVSIKPKLREKPLCYQYTKPYNDWQKIEAGGQQAIHDPVLDAELTDDRRISIEYDDRLWLPSEPHETVRALKVSTLDFDEEKVRLESDLLAGATVANVRRTRYSAFLVTNRLAAYEYRKKAAPHEFIEFPDRGTGNEPRLPRLPLSNCSNHVGADVLAISGGRLLLQRQAGRSALNEGKVAGSGSGSADWRDVQIGHSDPSLSRPDLLSFVRYTMWREMVEELGLLKSQRPPPEKIKVVGYSRLTSLGGKPQFYGVASFGPVETRITGKDKLYTAEHLTIEFDPQDRASGLLDALDQVRHIYGDEVSFPLHVNIKMIRQWLKRNPEAAIQWLWPRQPS